MKPMKLREPVRLPVQAGLSGEARTLAGWLSEPADGDLLLILVHGGFCSHRYWDGPYRPEAYSLVTWANEHGLTTLNIDRLGAGESARPPGDMVDAHVGAATLAEIVALARAGQIGARRFAKVALVGHSYGSLVSGLCQAEYGAADAVAMTGVTGINVIGVADTPEAHARFLLGNPPANGAYGAPRGDEAYRVMGERRRVPAFFHEPAAEPGMIQADAATAGVMTAGEHKTMGLASDAGPRIGAPVLVQMGRFDRLAYNAKHDPDASRIHDRARAAAPANFTFAPLAPDAGHNLAQHPGARGVYDQMLDWLREQGLA